jgi:murein DD-endopeptidase MepM/ murein hydrolase activator NlpD
MVGLAVSGTVTPVDAPRRAQAPPGHQNTSDLATDIIGVAAQISGTVAKVHVAPRERVTAGTVLLELERTNPREALARAHDRITAAQQRASMARSRLTEQERAVSLAIRAALETVPRLKPEAPPVRARPQISDDGTAAAIERARAQLAAAQIDVVKAAEAQVATTQDTMARDKALLSQGAIPARQLSEDGAAYQSALQRAQAAEAALRQAREVRPGSAADRSRDRAPEAAIEHAQHILAASQDTLRAAQAERAAGQQAVDRDKVLLAEGAVPAQQLNTDILAYDAAGVRVAAAAAAVQHAEAQLRAARTAPQRSEATVRPAPPRRPGVSHAERLAHLAQTRILEAQHGAQRLAVAEAEVVDAEAAVRTAEADLARTLIRAPVDGWVTNPMAMPGERVQSRQLVVSLLTPRRAALRLQDLPRTDRDPASDRGERLAQIAADEHVALTRLRAESERVKAIILGSAGGQRGGPVPTFLRDVLRRPVPGEITSGYGWRIHPIFQTMEFHTGIDIAAPWGAPVEAPADGTVIFAGEMPANGMLLILDHGNGLSTTYSHLSSRAVHVGDHVRRGQMIARIGSTGWSTGPHRFFEVRAGGQPIDPLVR